MDPLSRIRSDLSNDDISVRIKCITHLPLVAKFLAGAQVPNKLIPLLERHCFRDSSFGPVTSPIENNQNGSLPFKALANDEDISQLALHLNGLFYENAGGFAYCSKQLAFLEKCASHEETLVREAATQSLVEIIKIMKGQEVHDKVWPIFCRMATSTWFPNKCSLAFIAPSVFGKIEDPGLREKILEEYKKTIRNNMHLVRLQAYKQLCNLIEIAPPKFYDTHFRAFLHHVSHESNFAGKTSINTRTDKFNLVKVALTMLESYSARAMSDSEVVDATWKWLEAAGTHESWRLRTEFIKCAPRICEMYSKLNTTGDHNTESVYPICLSILVDSEPQVREVAIGKFTECLPYFQVEDKKELLQKLTSLSKDDTQQVKEKFAKNVIKIFRAAQLNVKDLMDIIYSMKNEASANTNVIAMNFCSNLGDLVAMMQNSDEDNSTLYELVEEWFRDLRWRIRWAIITSMGEVCKHYSLAEFEKSPFKVIMVKAFDDVAFEVREEACRQVPFLVSPFGQKFVFDTLLAPTRTHFETSKNYHLRLSLFQIIRSLATVLDAPSFNNNISNFPKLLLEGLSDPVVNVRIVVCETVLASANLLEDSQTVREIKNKLTDLQGDSDLDCSYFSSLALQELSGRSSYM